MRVERQILFRPLDVEGDGRKITKSIIFKALKFTLFLVTSHRCNDSFVVVKEKITGT